MSFANDPNLLRKQRQQQLTQYSQDPSNGDTFNIQDDLFDDSAINEDVEVSLQPKVEPRPQVQQPRPQIQQQPRPQVQTPTPNSQIQQPKPQVQTPAPAPKPQVQQQPRPQAPAPKPVPSSEPVIRVEQPIQQPKVQINSVVSKKEKVKKAERKKSTILGKLKEEKKEIKYTKVHLSIKEDLVDRLITYASEEDVELDTAVELILEYVLNKDKITANESLISEYNEKHKKKRR